MHPKLLLLPLMTGLIALALGAPPAHAEMEPSVAIEDRPVGCETNYYASPGSPPVRQQVAQDEAQLLVDGNYDSRAHYRNGVAAAPALMQMICTVDLQMVWQLDRVAIAARSNEGNSTRYNAYIGLFDGENRPLYVDDMRQYNRNEGFYVFAFEFTDEEFLPEVRYIQAVIEWVSDGATTTPRGDWGISEFYADGRVSDTLPTPTSTEELTTPEELAAVSAVGMGALELVAGPAAPLVAITEEQVDSATAMADAVLRNAPLAELQELGAYAVDAWESLEASIIEPTNESYYRSVDTAVRPLMNYRVPNPWDTVKRNAPLTVETATCLRYQYDCARSIKAPADAKLETLRKYKENGNGDPSDAFRHCYVQALITKRSNAEFARRMGDAHEEQGFRDGTNTVASYRMDEHNNVVGRRIGGGGGRDTTVSHQCEIHQLGGRLLRRGELPSGTYLVWLHR